MTWIEHKNTIIAIVLSLLVVVGWQYFIGYPQMESSASRKRSSSRNSRKSSRARPSRRASRGQSSQSPAASPASARRCRTRPPASRRRRTRESVIGATPRVAIDTPRLGGSIDLKGGRIDDLTLTQYRETIDPNSPPIVLFSPSGAPDAYYAEFGWVPASGTTAALPGPDTVWKQQGSGALGIDHPVTLTYDNGQGLVFTRTIAVDDHYLFTSRTMSPTKAAAR